MNKWLKNILGFVIIGFLLWYLAGHWDRIKELVKLSWLQLGCLYALYGVATIIVGRVVQLLVGVLNIKTGFWDMVRLYNAAILLNYAPMKLGTIFRANYLKRYYGLSYSHFASFFLYTTFLMTAMATIIGLIILTTVYDLEGYQNKILALVFAIIIAGSFSFLFAPLPQPKGKGRLSTMLRDFLLGRAQMSKERRTVLGAVVFLSINFMLTAVRFGIIYHSMGVSIHPAGCLFLGAMGFVVLFIGLTPGSLGIREFVVSSGAVIIGIPPEVAILAAMMDRAVTLSYVFVVGGGCVAWLWHKSPEDFKKNKNNKTLQENQNNS